MGLGIPNTWSGLFESWNQGIRDATSPAAAFRVNDPLPEPGLIDISGGIGSIGSKVLATKLIKAAKPVAKINPEMAHLVDISPAMKNGILQMSLEQPPLMVTMHIR